jgi:hypothetical protein
MPVSSAR